MITYHNHKFKTFTTRLSTGRKKVSLLRELSSRRKVKVALFGRTSSGKSSVINALLGEPVLPCGLGRTTGCFVEVRGTAQASPCLLLPKGGGGGGGGGRNELDLVEVEPRCSFCLNCLNNF